MEISESTNQELTAIATKLGSTADEIKKIYESAYEEVGFWTEDPAEREKKAIRKTAAKLQRKKISGARAKRLYVAGYSAPKDFAEMMRNKIARTILEKGNEYAMGEGYVDADGNYLDYSNTRNKGKPLPKENRSADFVVIDLETKKFASLNIKNQKQAEDFTAAHNHVVDCEVVVSQKDATKYYLNNIASTNNKLTDEDTDALIKEAIKASKNVPEENLLAYLKSGETMQVVVQGMIINYGVGNKVNVQVQIPGDLENTLRVWIDYLEAENVLRNEIPVYILVEGKINYNSEKKEYVGNSSFIYSEPKYRQPAKNIQDDVGTTEEGQTKIDAEKEETKKEEPKAETGTNTVETKGAAW